MESFSRMLLEYQKLQAIQMQQHPVHYALHQTDVTVESPILLSQQHPSSPSSLSSKAVSAIRKKPKRKQVKNACINCQKACKRCDEGRACKRCIKLGLEATCVNSPRKPRRKGVKRGPYKKRQEQQQLEQQQQQQQDTICGEMKEQQEPYVLDWFDPTLEIDTCFYDGPTGITSQQSPLSLVLQPEEELYYYQKYPELPSQQQASPALSSAVSTPPTYSTHDLFLLPEDEPVFTAPSYYYNYPTSTSTSTTAVMAIDDHTMFLLAHDPSAAAAALSCWQYDKPNDLMMTPFSSA